MTFFDEISPQVDWKRKQVFARGQKLPVQCYERADAHLKFSKNSFDGLVIQAGVDTRDCSGGDMEVARQPVSTGDDVVNVCGYACDCASKVGDLLMCSQNASVQDTHAQGGSVKALGNSFAISSVIGQNPRVAGKGVRRPSH